MESSTRLDELLSLWQRQWEAGISLSAEELCANNPELLTQIKERIEALSSMEGFLQSTKDFVSAQEQSTNDLDATGNYQPKSDLEVPEKIGHYEIRGEIARGGMGVVLRAYDPDFERTLALKVTLDKHQGHEQAEKRFVEEAKITGQLQHPGIPPVHELGRLPDGRPFFAMKLIDGQTLSDLLRARKSASESLPHFLGIFEQICQTIAYAHNQNVIHRDLKPLNIMVGAFGEVQVMDWGLAKKLGTAKSNDTALSDPIKFANNNPEMTTDWQKLVGTDEDSRTRAGAILGTITHMAPEQARGEIAEVDKASDVFGLGAILCQILTGEPPFTGKTVADILPKARKGDWQGSREKLEQSGVDAELVALTKKCLAPDKQKRFADAAELALAIAAYQEGVQEKLKQSEVERATAEARALSERKSRRTQLTAVGVVVALLTLGIIAAVWGLVQINEARNSERIAKLKEKERAEGELLAKLDAQKKEGIAKRLAEAERLAKHDAENNLDYARKGNEILGSVFTDLDPKANYQTVAELRNALRENLKKAIEELEGSAIGEPLEVAKMQNTLAGALLGLGEAKLAIRILEKALETRKTKFAFDHPNILLSMNNLAVVYRNAGMFDKAMPLLKTAIQICEEGQFSDHEFTSTLMNNLAETYLIIGNWDTAQPILEKTLKLCKTKLGNNQPVVLQTMNNLATCYLKGGNLERCMPLCKEVFQLTKTQLGPNHPYTLISMNNLANCYLEIGNLKQALPLFEETLKLRTAKLGSDHPNTLTSMNNLATCYFDAGNLERAIPLFEETLRICKTKKGQEHPETLSCTSTLANCYLKAKKTSLAIPLFEAMLEFQKRTDGPNQQKTLVTMNNLALCYYANDRLDQALLLSEEIVERFISQFGRNNPKATMLIENLESVYTKTSRDPTTWAGFLEKLYHDRKKDLGDSHAKTLMAMTALGAGYRNANKLDRAKPLLLKAFQFREKHLLADWVASELVALYLQKGEKGTETKLNGSLSSENSEREHDVKLQKRGLYVIDMTSNDFDTLLRVENAEGTKLAENDDVDLRAKNLNSRIIFVPPADGQYRLIATSYQNKGRGTYEITIRDFSLSETSNEKPSLDKDQANPSGPPVPSMKRG